MTFIKQFINFKESLNIIRGDEFSLKFGINIEDMEDYLTELTDEYEVIVYDVDDYNKRNPSIKIFNDGFNKFCILIGEKNSNDPIKDFFNPHTIIMRMEQFIKRIRKFDIEFCKLNVLEYKNRSSYIEYQFQKIGPLYHNYKKTNEGFKTWADQNDDVEKIEDYLMEISDEYDVEIIKMHPIRKLFSVIITNKERSDFIVDNEKMTKFIKNFINRLGAVYISTHNYSNGIRYTFEIK